GCGGVRCVEKAGWEQQPLAPQGLASLRPTVRPKTSSAFGSTASGLSAPWPVSFHRAGFLPRASSNTSTAPARSSSASHPYTDDRLVTSFLRVSVVGKSPPSGH